MLFRWVTCCSVCVQNLPNVNHPAARMQTFSSFRTISNEVPHTMTSQHMCESYTNAKAWGRERRERWEWWLSSITCTHTPIHTLSLSCVHSAIASVRAVQVYNQRTHSCRSLILSCNDTEVIFFPWDDLFGFYLLYRRQLFLCCFLKWDFTPSSLNVAYPDNFLLPSYYNPKNCPQWQKSVYRTFVINIYRLLAIMTVNELFIS